MSTITDLIPLLSEKTTEKKLSWNIGTDSDIWVRISSNMIEIEEKLEDYTIRIRNSQGNIVDYDYITSKNPIYKAISDIYYLARRQASKADENIEHIIRQLEKL